jgi:hypothetical protein
MVDRKKIRRMATSTRTIITLFFALLPLACDGKTSNSLEEAVSEVIADDTTGMAFFDEARFYSKYAKSLIPEAEESGAFTSDYIGVVSDIVILSPKCATFSQADSTFFSGFIPPINEVSELLSGCDTVCKYRIIYTVLCELYGTKCEKYGPENDTIAVLVGKEPDRTRVIISPKVYYMSTGRAKAYFKEKFPDLKLPDKLR